MEEEIWKPVKGFENYYKVSNLGNVISVRRNMQLKKMHDSDGYLLISLYKEQKIIKGKIHRLVAQHFIPNPENKKTVNHKNGNKNDNSVSNLEWMTPSENSIHSFQVLKNLPPNPNKGKRGSQLSHSISVDQFDLNGNYIRTWDCMKTAEREEGFCASTISKCTRGLKNKHRGFIWKRHVSTQIAV